MYSVPTAVVSVKCRGLARLKAAGTVLADATPARNTVAPGLFWDGATVSVLRTYEAVGHDLH